MAKALLQLLFLSRNSFPKVYRFDSFVLPLSLNRLLLQVIVSLFVILIAKR